ncbi:hypothetical protein [Paenibacillus lutrae]|uniref:Uncharacterized protein n=1 Tax=Paenibacillus lutrae TaxID=2078573 RepID=A0A7X3FGY0_9BACL|nr:hypothetical protein [Paenibacillus lutrae]MVO99444.1 hypothetical protein [Paenibacillus lutrae]
MAFRRTLLTASLFSDKLILNVLNKPAAPNTPGFGKDPELEGTADIEIAGFADTNTGMEFYNTMFINPERADKFRTEGFRWEYLTEKGEDILNVIMHKKLTPVFRRHQLSFLNEETACDMTPASG